MKLIIAIGLLALSAACSFNSRSGAFECSDTSPCSDSNRVCSDGWCVISGAGTPDGPVGAAADAFVCPSECTRCESEVCVIECAATNSCPATVLCPAGVACRVQCNGVDSCANGIDCTMATECQLNCGGVDSCAEKLDCGAGLCDINCSGIDSCAAGLNCSDSCDCNASCPLGCGVNECPGSSACFKDNLCTNTPGSCRVCAP
jgi:hypothetical protein